MSSKAKWSVLVLVSVALFLLAWITRYEHIESCGYRDRWFGRLVYLTEDGFSRPVKSSPVKFTGTLLSSDDISAYAKKAKEEGLTPEEMVTCARKLMDKGLTSEQADSILLGIPLKLSQKDVEDLIKATPVLTDAEMSAAQRETRK